MQFGDVVSIGAVTNTTGPAIAGDEIATLVGSLERQRRIFAWKCGESVDDLVGEDPPR